MKKSSKSSLKKKGLLIYLSSIKTELAINFLTKLLHLAEKRAGGERVNKGKEGEPTGAAVVTTGGTEGEEEEEEVEGVVASLFPSTPKTTYA